SLSGCLGTSEPSNLFALAFAKVAVAHRSNRDRGHAGGKRKLLSLAARFGAESSFTQTRGPKLFQLRRALAQRFASELRTRNPGRAWSAPGENSLCSFARTFPNRIGCFSFDGHQRYCSMEGSRTTRPPFCWQTKSASPPLSFAGTRRSSPDRE